MHRCPLHRTINYLQFCLYGEGRVLSWENELLAMFMIWLQLSLTLASHKISLWALLAIPLSTPKLLERNRFVVPNTHKPWTDKSAS
jgi:hypothetical protein